jgi:hypothetical protein
MPVNIRSFRLSLVWTETHAGLLGHTVAPQADFEFLTRRDLYEKRFPLALAGNDPAGLQAPWQNRKRQLFWLYYLGTGTTLPAVPPGHAWQSLVPLRRELARDLPLAPDGVAAIEGFFYPHGLSLAITVKFAGAFSPAAAAQAAWNLKRANGAKLAATANAALQRLRDALLGPGAAPGPQREVFTIFSVLKAEGSTRPLPQDPDLGRMLEIVTAWPANPGAAGPATPAGCVPVRKRASQHSVICSGSRARAVWFPREFTARDPSVCSIACFHRNLLFGTMQVDSLGALVATVAALVRGGTPHYNLYSTLLGCAKHAVKRLETIHQGDQSQTYKSRGLQRQIQENDLADLNFLRQLFTPAVAPLV